MAGRPFFIAMGVTQASSAPAAKSVSIQLAASSPVASSTLASTIACVAVAPWPSWRPEARSVGAEHRAENVRSIAQLGRARAPADALGRHRGPAVGPRGVRADDRGAGRRDELEVEAPVVGREPREALDGRGGGQRELAVRGLDEAASHRQRGDEDLGAQVVERRRAAHHVGDGVDRRRPRESARRRSARDAPSPRPSRGAGRCDGRVRARPPAGPPGRAARARSRTCGAAAASRRAPRTRSRRSRSGRASRSPRGTR